MHCPPTPHPERLFPTCSQRWANHRGICSLPTWPRFDRQSFCLLGNEQGTNRERTVGMPPDCYPQLRKGFSECRTVFRFCSAERPPTTSARWYLCYHENLTYQPKQIQTPGEYCKCMQMSSLHSYTIQCAYELHAMTFCRTEGRRPCRCSGLAQWQSPWRPTRSSE